MQFSTKKWGKFIFWTNAKLRGGRGEFGKRPSQVPQPLLLVVGWVYNTLKTVKFFFASFHSIHLVTHCGKGIIIGLVGVWTWDYPLGALRLNHWVQSYSHSMGATDFVKSPPILWIPFRLDLKWISRFFQLYFSDFHLAAAVCFFSNMGLWT